MSPRLPFWSPKPSAAVRLVPTSSNDNTIDATATAGVSPLHLKAKHTDGHVMEYEFTPSPTAVGGINGVKLSRDAAVRPLGFNYYTAGTYVWTANCLDATTTDFVFIYDPDDSSDQFRWGKGARLKFGRSIGTPDADKRLHILVQAQDLGAISDMLFLDNRSVAGDLDYFIRASKSSGPFTFVFTVDVNGKTGIGRAFDGTAPGLQPTNFLEVQNGLSIVGPSIDTVVRYARTTDAGAHVWESYVGSSGHWRVRDLGATGGATAHAVLTLEAGALDGAFYAKADGTSIVSPVGGKVAFYGGAGVARQATLPADATDLASVITLANAIKAAIRNLNLTGP